MANAALRDALPKEDRHLRIAPRFFDRDETPAIFVTSLRFLIRARWFVMSRGCIIVVAAPHGPLLPSIFRSTVIFRCGASKRLSPWPARAMQRLE